jgi:hypothetical protein
MNPKRKQKATGTWLTSQSLIRSLAMQTLIFSSTCQTIPPCCWMDLMNFFMTICCKPPLLTQSRVSSMLGPKEEAPLRKRDPTWLAQHLDLAHLLYTTILGMSLPRVQDTIRRAPLQLNCPHLECSNLPGTIRSNGLLAGGTLGHPKENQVGQKTPRLTHLTLGSRTRDSARPCNCHSKVGGFVLFSKQLNSLVHYF